MRLWVPGWSSISTRICILNIMINITNFRQPYKLISQITPKKKKKNYEQNLITKLIITLRYNLIQYIFIGDKF